MENDPKIWWIRGHLWQHVSLLQPVEADSREEAIKLFKEATATAKDVVIQGVSQDPEELIGTEFGDEPQEDKSPLTNRTIN